MRYMDNGGGDESQVLGSWLDSFEPQEIQAIRLQTGFFSRKALPWLEPMLLSLLDRGLPAHAILGSNDMGTGAEHVLALIELMGLPRDDAALAVCAFGQGYFHPKVIHLTLNHDEQAAYVGSANLTGQGVRGTHVEAGVVVDTREGDPLEELVRIATAIDDWFTRDEASGLFVVDSADTVDVLLSRGILAPKGIGGEHTGPRRKNDSGETPDLPKRKPLLKAKVKRKGGETGVAGDSGGDSEPASFFIMELSKNRISAGSYQADVGHGAYTDFFGGEVGTEVVIKLETVYPNGDSGGVRDRQLVFSGRSNNYRVEIEFPGTYPESGRPIVVFKRKAADSFAAMLLKPDDTIHSEASDVLETFREPGGRVNSMRRAFVSMAELEAEWSDCPLLVD